MKKKSLSLTSIHMSDVALMLNHAWVCVPVVEEASGVREGHDGKGWVERILRATGALYLYLDDETSFIET